MTDHWVRLPQFFDLHPIPLTDHVCLLVPVQLRHIFSQGVASQALLSGPGLTDMRVEEVQRGREPWTFDQAVAYALDNLQSFKSTGRSSTEVARHEYALAVVEAQSWVVRGRLCVAPCGMHAQELLLPIAEFRRLAEYALGDAQLFQIAGAVALQCLRTRTLDHQPKEVAAFLDRWVTGAGKPSGKVPKKAALNGRDVMLWSLVSGMVWHGLSATRNDASPPLSACDAVAEGARKAGLSGATSYESVRKIYMTIQKEYAALERRQDIQDI